MTYPPMTSPGGGTGQGTPYSVSPVHARLLSPLRNFEFVPGGRGTGP